MTRFEAIPIVGSTVEQMREMSDRQYHMTVWVGDDAVCLRIVGRANLHASVKFKQVVQSLRDKGHLRFVLDLTDCRLMDSTFLGVLARLGIDAAVAVDKAPRVIFDLLNPNARVQELLDTLGVHGYFKCVQARGDHFECLEPTEPLEPREIEQPDRVALTRASLEAHKALMKANPNNVAKFQDVVNYLAEELQGMEGKIGDLPDSAPAPANAATKKLLPAKPTDCRENCDNPKDGESQKSSDAKPPDVPSGV